MFRSFGDSFNYARAQIVANQSKIWGPAFHQLKLEAEFNEVPSTCKTDAFAQCLIDTGFQDQTFQYGDGGLEVYGGGCAKQYGCVTPRWSPEYVAKSNSYGEGDLWDFKDYSANMLKQR